MSALAHLLDATIGLELRLGPAVLNLTPVEVVALARDWGGL